MTSLTPKKDGFRMPAEFGTHQKTYMIWPTRTDTWRENAEPAQREFAQVANAIADFEPVTMLTPESEYQRARNQLNATVNVQSLKTNDAWVRDIGPTFVSNDNQLRGINWKFNAWGGYSEGLYFPWDLDDQAAIEICEMEKTRIYDAPLIMEGGALHVDGEGTAIVTESCLLNPNRNPHLTKEKIENYLCEFLAVEKVLWLPFGLYQDETNGHVDNCCCFIRPQEVMLAWTTDKTSPQYELSKANYEYLSTATDAKGRHLTIHLVEVPVDLRLTEQEAETINDFGYAKKRAAGDYLSASYINFYFCNGGIILPSFGHSLDRIAYAQFRELFAERKIIQLPSREILLGGGNIHCITQQVPFIRKDVRV
ncbi:MAG: agmatine deiminase [Enterococcus avium]